MIDETDIKIIDYLRKDGRASFSEIADDIGIATSTVAGRVKKLEEKGIITGFRPVIDYEELGFELTAMIDIRAESQKIVETAERLKQNERVISFFEVTGETDMIIISRFTDREDMNSFLKTLQSIEGIKSTETNVVLTEPRFEDNIDIKSLLDRGVEVL